MKFKKFTSRLAKGNSPLLAVLIDPDKFNPDVVHLAAHSNVACFLVGGSVLNHGKVPGTVAAIKKISSIPVILFPGDETQLSGNADGLLFPSLLSGNNAEYLIGKQTIMAPLVKRMKLPYLPMAYLLLNGDAISATQVVTRTQPLHEKKQILNVALAAEMLGFKVLYLEAGSGALNNVAPSLVKAVREYVSLPVVVGGGIDSAKKARELIKAGASMLVVGNALEKNVSLLKEIGSAFKVKNNRNQL